MHTNNLYPMHSMHTVYCRPTTDCFDPTLIFLWCGPHLKYIYTQKVYSLTSKTIRNAIIQLFISTVWLLSSYYSGGARHSSHF